MARFDLMKQYIFEETDERATESKHAFYKLTKEDILDSEKRIGRKFPQELRNFYYEIGYGFMCAHNEDMFDRLMDPGSVADFRLGEGIYESDPETEGYEENQLAFFEVSETTFITLDLSKEDESGVCPVYYFETEIASSLLEFIERMDEDDDYYLE